MTAAPAPCPVCGGLATATILRQFSIGNAAEHFIPSKRSPARNEQLRALLIQLWNGQDFVQVRRCDTCLFAFAWPFVAGSPDFYNLVSEGDPHYPRHRWEFDRTLRSLQEESVTSMATIPPL